MTVGVCVNSPRSEIDNFSQIDFIASVASSIVGSSLFEFRELIWINEFLICSIRDSFCKFGL